MSFTTKIATGVMLAAATSTALTGCGKKSSSKPSTSAMPSTSSSTTMSTAPSTSTKPSSSATAKAGFVTATIGGKTKYLKAGQQCQKAHADEYTQYGFTCAANSSGTYYLTKN